MGPDSPSDFLGVIDAIGAARLAELLGAPIKTVQQMRYRNSVAPEHWRLIAVEAEARGLAGVDLEFLQGLWERRVGQRLKLKPGGKHGRATA